MLSAAIISLLVAGCHNNPSSPAESSAAKFTYRDPYPWPTSAPITQGLDTAKVSAALGEIRGNPFILSFLVIRNDTLAVEYYNKLTKDNDYEIHSAAKSFTSALLGIAIDRGLIKSSQEKVLSFFPDFDTSHIDPRKRDWTLENFLTMRSGIDWNEDADHTTLFTDKVNWMTTTLGLPLRSAPGTQFIYTTPNVNLLSGIITRVSGISTYDFAEQNLFTPLNISVRSWLRDPQGVYTGGTGMRFTPRDLARLGQLYLHNGVIDGRQIISRQWIQSTLVQRNSSNRTWGDLQSVNYGYLWWNNYDTSDSLFMAAGFAGQFVIVIPAKNMIIVTIGDDNVTTEQASINENIMLGILNKYLF
jgi:CubicO group peptidase (beta-lactamase class C family)